MSQSTGVPVNKGSLTFVCILNVIHFFCLVCLPVVLSIKLFL